MCSRSCEPGYASVNSSMAILSVNLSFMTIHQPNAFERFLKELGSHYIGKWTSVSLYLPTPEGYQANLAINAGQCRFQFVSKGCWGLSHFSTDQLSDCIAVKVSIVGHLSATVKHVVKTWRITG